MGNFFQNKHPHHYSSCLELPPSCVITAIHFFRCSFTSHYLDVIICFHLQFPQSTHVVISKSTRIVYLFMYLQWWCSPHLIEEVEKKFSAEAVRHTETDTHTPKHKSGTLQLRSSFSLKIDLIHQLPASLGFFFVVVLYSLCVYSSAAVVVFLLYILLPN